MGKCIICTTSPTESESELQRSLKFVAYDGIATTEHNLINTLCMLVLYSVVNKESWWLDPSIGEDGSIPWIVSF